MKSTATLLKVGAKIHYHGTRMRPGHPALLATYSSSPSSSLSSNATNHQLAVFGLPGNPCAAAATLRFMVRPLLRLSMGRCIEEPSFKARLSLSAQDKSSQKHAHNHSGVNGHHMTEKHSPNGIVSSSTASTACGSGSTSQGHRSYLLAKYDGYDEHGVRIVKTLNKGSGMIRPLSEADCWVLVKEEQSDEEGTLVNCYPISAGMR